MKLSVVIPVYHCEPCLQELYNRLTSVCKKAVADYELVFVEDRGRDGSWRALKELAKQDKKVVALRLSRNFGQHIAITAGLKATRGDSVIVMDCDLQDPPEVINDLLEEASKGFEIVLARRKKKRQSLFRKIAARSYFWVLNKVSGSSLDGEFGTLSYLSRKAVDAYLRVNDIQRHYLFIIDWIGFDRSIIEYIHGDRHSGASSYSFKRLLYHAAQGVLFQTSAFLKWIMMFGIGTSIVGLGLGAYFTVNYFISGSQPGWTSLAVLILVLSGVILMSLGIVGIYVGQVFEHVKGRPLYVVDEMIRIDT